MKNYKKVIIKKDSGRLFAMGDIHGEYDGFMKELDRVGFDKEKDLVVAVGDLVDRGPKNKEVVDLLKEPWFVSTMGNHCLMTVRGDDNLESHIHWVSNGGGWASRYKKTPEVLEEIRATLEKLPVAIEVQFHEKKYGFVHAGVPGWDWKNLDKVNKGELLGSRGPLWMRDQIMVPDKRVKNIDLVFHGHTPVEDFLKRGNRMYIDKKLCRGGTEGLFEIKP